MFIREITLYADYLRDEIEQCSSGVVSRPANYFDEFKKNLLSGIKYYRRLAQQLNEQQRQRFLDELEVLHEAIESILLVTVESICVNRPAVLLELDNAAVDERVTGYPEP